MSVPISNSVATPQVTSLNTTGRTGPDALTAGAIAQANSGEPTSDTKVGTVAELRKKAPKLYQKMLEGIAMEICGDMKHHQDRLKEMMREANRR